MALSPEAARICRALESIDLKGPGGDDAVDGAIILRSSSDDVEK